MKQEALEKQKKNHFVKGITKKFAFFAIGIFIAFTGLLGGSSIASASNIHLQNLIQPIEIERVERAEYQYYMSLTEEEKEEIKEIPTQYILPAETLYVGGYDLEGVEEEVYDLRNDIPIQVEDQTQTGACYAYATNTAMETFLAKVKGEYYQFSASYMEIVYHEFASYARQAFYSGGNFQSIKSSCFSNGYTGVLLEECSELVINYGEPFSTKVNDYMSGFDIDNFTNFLDVNGTITFPYVVGTNKQYTYGVSYMQNYMNAIKNYLQNYGGLYTSINYDDTYFNSSTSAYNNSVSSGTTNHAVTIVGWDDNYSRLNFKSAYRPNTNGAWLALNSWGEGYGENGYFYISYEDYFVNTNMNGFAEITENKEYGTYNNLKGAKDAEGNYLEDSLITMRISNLNATQHFANIYDRGENYYNLEESVTRIRIQSHTSFPSAVYIGQSNTEGVVAINSTACQLVLTADSFLYNNYFLTGSDSGHSSLIIDIEPVLLTQRYIYIIIKYDSGSSVGLLITSPNLPNIKRTFMSQNINGFSTSNYVTSEGTDLYVPAELYTRDLSKEVAVSAFVEKSYNDGTFTNFAKFSNVLFIGESIGFVVDVYRLATSGDISYAIYKISNKTRTNTTTYFDINVIEEDEDLLRVDISNEDMEMENYNSFFVMEFSIGNSIIKKKVFYLKSGGSGFSMCNVTYYLNHGENDARNVETFLMYTPQDISLYPATRLGFSFQGWYTEATYTNVLTKIPTGTASDLNLYAKWQMNNLTTKLNTLREDGGTYSSFIIYGNTRIILEVEIEISIGVEIEYQWRKNGIDIVNEQNSKLYLKNYTDSTQTTYSCYVKASYEEQEKTTTLIANNINIRKKELNLASGSDLNKIYDGTNTVDITQVQIDSSGIVSWGGFVDKVYILSATYSSANVGDNIEITFSLDGEDKDNYRIANRFGNITPIINTVVWYIDSHDKDLASAVIRYTKTNHINRIGAYYFEGEERVELEVSSEQYLIEATTYVLNASLKEGEEGIELTNNTASVTIQKALVKFRAEDKATYYNSPLVELTYELVEGVLYDGDFLDIKCSTLAIPDYIEEGRYYQTYDINIWLNEENSSNNKNYIVMVEKGNYTVVHQKHTVQFIIDEEVVDEQEIYHTFSLDIIANPSKLGYRFIGWMEDGIVKNIQSFVVEKSTSFVAKWEKIYKANFKNTQGENILNALEYVIDEQMVLPNISEEREGYDFFGWRLGEKEYEYGSTIVMPEENTEFLAVWRIVFYTILYNANGGENAQNLVYEYSIESDDIPLPTMQKTGHTFIGWKEENGEETLMKISTGSTGNKVLVAHYSINKYTVVFILPNGESMEKEIEYNTPILDLKKLLPLKVGELAIFISINDQINSGISVVVEDIIIKVKYVNVMVWGGVFILLLFMLIIFISKKIKVNRYKKDKELLLKRIG